MASVSDPFLLHSYALPSNVTTARAASSSRLPHVQATVTAQGDGTEVVVTVQSDGVHVVDLSTLHPVASHTLGPSTLFSSPAVSRIAKDRQKRTLVGIASAADAGGEGKTVWAWSEGGDENTARLSVEFPHPVAQLLTSPNLPSLVIAVSHHGATTLATLELEVAGTLSPSSSNMSWQKHVLFSRQSCSFFPAQRSDGEEALLVSLGGEKDGVLGLRLVRVNESGLEEAWWTVLEDIKLAEILDVSCEASGHLSVLDRTGKWHLYRISSNPHFSCLLLSITNDTIPDISNTIPDPSSTSLLALASSHVLRAFIPSSNRQLHLQIWDLQYSVLLASHTVALPTSLPQPAGVKLVYATAGQALVVLSPTLGQKIETKARSSILVVPYTAPRESSLLSALGHVPSLAPDKPSTVISVEPEESRRDLVLKAVENALKRGTPEDAEKVFFAWTEGKALPLTNGHAPHSDSENEGHSTNPSTQSKAMTKTFKPDLPRAFVARLVQLLIIPAKPSNPSQSKILHYLLEKGVVSYGVADSDEGLLGVLSARGDWPCIYSAMRCVPDIPESAVVQILSGLLAATRASDAMVIERVDAPTLPSFLALVASAPSSSPALRTALKEQVTDMGDVLRILDILSSWIDLSVLRGWEMDKGDQARVKARQEKQREYSIPKIEHTLAFLQTILDTYFISLLQFSPARPVLRRLAESLTPQLELASQLERLRGPLEPFAKEKRREKTPKGAASKEDWRQRRRRAREADELNVGLYTVEEFSL